MSTNPFVLVLIAIQYVFGAASLVTAFSNAVMYALVFLALYNFVSWAIKRVQETAMD